MYGNKSSSSPLRKRLYADLMEDSSQSEANIPSSRLAPVIISLLEGNSTFKSMNIKEMELFCKSITDQAGEPLNSLVQSRGDLFVYPRDAVQQKKLLDLQEAAYKKIKCSLPKSSTIAKGVITNVPVEFSEEDLLAHLQEQGIEEVRRTTRQQGEEREATETVILSATGSLPERVKVLSMSFPVRPHFPAPFRCKKCMRLGHTQGRCKSTEPSCPTCCRHHDGANTCSMWCINCEGSDHRADSPDCPAFLEMKAVIKLSVLDGIPIREAKEKFQSLSSQKMVTKNSLSLSLVEQIPPNSREVQNLREQIAALRMDMRTIRTEKLPAMEYNLGVLNRRVDAADERIAALQENIDSRLDGLSKSQKKMEKNLNNRFDEMNANLAKLLNLIPHDHDDAPSQEEDEEMEVNEPFTQVSPRRARQQKNANGTVRSGSEVSGLRLDQEVDARLRPSGTQGRPLGTQGPPAQSQNGRPPPRLTTPLRRTNSTGLNPRPAK